MENLAGTEENKSSEARLDQRFSLPAGPRHALIPTFRMNETETRDRRRLRWALAAALALHVGVMFARLPEGWRPKFVAPAEGGPAINFEMVELIEATAASAPSEAAEPPAATPEPPMPLVAEQRPVEEEAPMPTPEPMVEERVEEQIEQAPPPPVAQPKPKAVMPPPRVRPTVAPNPVISPKPAAKVAPHPSVASAASSGGAASVPGTPGARVADRGPQALNCPLPPYPPGARSAEFQGVARLRVTVGTDGRPQSVSVAQSSGRADCDAAACDTVRRAWRFAAAVRGGHPTEGALTVAVRFSLGG